MNKEKKDLVFDFSSIPWDLSDAKIEQKIMVADSFGGVIPESHKRIAEGFNMHTHSQLTVVVLCKQGNVKLRMNLMEEEIKAGQLFFILPHCTFEVHQVSNDFEGALVVCTPDTMFVSDDTLVDMSIRRYISTHHNIIISPHNLDVFMNLYKMLKQSLLDVDNPFREQVVRKYCQIIVYEGCRCFLKESFTSVKECSRASEVFERFIRCVEKDYKKERQIQYYADQLNLTSKYLSAVIKDVSHRFASEWIDEYVILEAKALLRQPNLSIGQISEMLNFANQSFFGRYFKHHTGLSPKEFRKKKE